MSQRITLISTTRSLLRRMTALLGVVMMLTLTLASGSPVVHDWLHEDSSHDTDHQCAVVLFATGVTLAPDATELTPAEMMCRAQQGVTFEDVFLISPRYLRQPERGPPVS